MKRAAVDKVSRAAVNNFIEEGLHLRLLCWYFTVFVQYGVLEIAGGKRKEVGLQLAANDLGHHVHRSQQNRIVALSRLLFQLLHNL